MTKTTGARDSKRERGFSLMELLVALVILALIVGLVAPQVLGYLGRGRSQTAEVQIGNIKSALSLYMLDMGRYPSTTEGLDALVKAPAGVPAWKGPYLDDGKLPVDPWSRPYRYELSPDNLRARVYTLGADDAPGGDGENADIG